MIKVAILDDYQNVFQEFVDLKKLEGKYEIKIFSEPFKNEEEVIGCCYIYPSDNHEFEVQAYYWIRQDLLSSGLETKLGNTFKAWLEKTWPFKKIEFPRRDL